MARRIFNVAAVAAGFALALPGAAAHAGTYHVYSCRTPNGASAPVDGWSGSAAGTFTDATNTCSQPGGALIAALGDQPAHAANSDFATWAFSAPANETLSGAVVWRAGDAFGGATVGGAYEVWFAGPSNVNNAANAFDLCVNGMQCLNGVGNFSQPFGAGNRLSVPAPNLGPHLYFNASCIGESGSMCPAGKGDASLNSAALYLFAADLTLEDNEVPHATNASGELASEPVIQGQSDLSFDATDSGSGVYEAVFSVDGSAVQRTVLNSNGGHCKDVGQTTDGLAAFLYVQPCPAWVSVDVPFDTTQVANGPHRLVVSVIDAAGNTAPVLDRSITIANPPPPGSANGTNASTQATMWLHWMKVGKNAAPKATYRTRFGGNPPWITGRLIGPGRVPISGALIDLSIVPSYAGARTVQIERLKTGPDGAFAMRIRGAARSQSLTFAYRAHVGDAQPAVAHTLTLKVPASIALSVSPHTTSAGHRIVFHGLLRGSPIPRGGKQLVLEARSPGSPWIEFKVVRTDARGRYRASYRFKFAGPANYRFRARSEAESDFPFAGGSSNVVAVHER
jgi:hypothetical protein